MNNRFQIAVFGGGCFWCTEAVFQNLKGVSSVAPGYAGGNVENPTYEQVCRGDTGHAEVIRVEFDSKEISYRDLLEVFFATHDPTTPNRQGNDVGEMYRSIIFYDTAEQKQEAGDFIKQLSADEIFNVPVITQLQPLERFYRAEDYHVRYYENNRNQPYCQAVINPKLKTLKEKYASLLKI